MDGTILIRLLLVFLWPLPTIMGVFYDLKSKYLYLFFVLFAVFVGINMYDLPTSDMYKYVTSSVEYKDVSLQIIFLEKDFVYPLLSKIITQFSSNFYFVTVCFTTIYFTVYYKCVKVVSSNIHSNYKTYIPWFYIFALYTILSFTVVTAFRYNLAVLYFSWCMLEYVINDKKKFLYLSILTPFIHFSFLFYIVLPFGYLFINKLKYRTNIALLIFVLSFVYSNSGMSSVVSNLSKQYLSESVSSQVDAYASEDGVKANAKRYKKAVENGSAKRAINRGIIDYSRQILMFSVAFFIVRRKRFLAKNKFYEQLLLLALLSYSLTNFVSSVLHGSRFFSVSNVLYYFILFYILASVKISTAENKMFYRKNKIFYNFVSIVVILSFFNSAYMAKIIFNFPNLIMGNWIGAYLYFDY
jgi:hypothetical protein